MKLRLITLLISVLSFFIFGFQYSYAAAPLTKVIMTSGSVSEREGAIYVAQEHGFFRKYGVDVSFVQVRNGPVGMAALSSG
jgi:ABC-type nitrate/sulfonate/bicarbonate transport system substrate-binding protein